MKHEVVLLIIRSATLFVYFYKPKHGCGTWFHIYKNNIHPHILYDVNVNMVWIELMMRETHTIYIITDMLAEIGNPVIMEDVFAVINPAFGRSWMNIRSSSNFVWARRFNILCILIGTLKTPWLVGTRGSFLVNWNISTDNTVWGNWWHILSNIPIIILITKPSNDKCSHGCFINRKTFYL